MQFLVAAIMGGLLQVAGSLLGRILLALGISFVTYTGFDTSITWLLNQIKSNMTALPADVLAFLAWLWVDKAIGVLFSAYSAALAIQTLGSATVTRTVQK